MKYNVHQYLFFRFLRGKINIVFHLMNVIITHRIMVKSSWIKQKCISSDHQHRGEAPRVISRFGESQLSNCTLFLLRAWVNKG